jgi:transposase
MARSSNAPAPHKDRWQAVNLKQHHPEWTLRQIAGKIGRSHAFVRKWNTCFELHGTVADQPRSGRPQKMTTEAAQQAMTATQDLDCKTAGAIAVRVEQQSGVKMSHSTTTRYLRKQGLQHLRPRTVPILTAKHKAARLAFAKAALRSTFQRALVTDSKIFRLAPMGRPAGRWCTPATRGTVGKPKHSEGVHVYMGMSCRGVTTLRFVTGTHKHIDRYTNPKTQQLYRGVGSKEYNDVLQHHLIPEGNRLFQSAGHWSGNWQLQQDNAPAHKTKENMACIAANVPGGHFLEWPPNSPDLSPIENLWAWMDKKLGDRNKIKDTAELQVKLIAIRDSITTKQLSKYFKGMRNRMERVVELHGAHIGK